MLHILYENADWLPPLEQALTKAQMPYRLLHMEAGSIAADTEPAEGIYLNRMSPSSHTRGNTRSVDFTMEYLAWLEAHDRRVINGSAAFALEISKLRQDMALRKYGIRTPRTVLCVGVEELRAAAETFTGPFLTKHNCSGKGLGIQLFENAAQLDNYLNAPEFDAGPREQIILQEYIEPAGGYITRVEIVGGKFLYAMQSSTSDGFELCPADVCQLPAANPDVCPIDGGGKFTPSPLTAEDPLVQQYITLCAGEGLDIAGIEFVENAAGERFTYDINGTTNYNSVVGEAVGVNGMEAIAKFIQTM